MKVKCIRNTTGNDDSTNIRYIDSEVGNEYLVMGILFKSLPRYFIMSETGYWVDSTFFEITDSHLGESWIVKQYWDYSDLVVSFPEMDSHFYNNLVEGQNDEIRVLEERIKEENKWYYNMDIDNFFEKYDTAFTLSEKKNIIQYYKSQPNNRQWERDKELLISSKI